MSSLSSTLFRSCSLLASQIPGNENGPQDERLPPFRWDSDQTAELQRRLQKADMTLDVSVPCNTDGPVWSIFHQKIQEHCDRNHIILTPAPTGTTLDPSTVPWQILHSQAVPHSSNGTRLYKIYPFTSANFTLAAFKGNPGRTFKLVPNYISEVPDRIFLFACNYSQWLSSFFPVLTTILGPRYANLRAPIWSFLPPDDPILRADFEDEDDPYLPHRCAAARIMHGLSMDTADLSISCRAFCLTDSHLPPAASQPAAGPSECRERVEMMEIRDSPEPDASTLCL